MTQRFSLVSYFLNAKTWTALPISFSFTVTTDTLCTEQEAHTMFVSNLLKKKSMSFYLWELKWHIWFRQKLTCHILLSTGVWNVKVEKSIWEGACSFFWKAIISQSNETAGVSLEKESWDRCNEQAEQILSTTMHQRYHASTS